MKNGLSILDAVHEPNELKIGNGKKSAIIIYQPSKHNAAYNITMAIANALADNDYSVVINHPSDKLLYDLTQYDLIAFGSVVYAGKFSSVLYNYIMSNRFKNKKVLAYTVGYKINDKTDLNELKVLLDDMNDVYTIKVKKGQELKIKQFVNEIIHE